ncbi:MAG: response regulator [Verrucomicrobiota bacterium]
MARVLIIEDDPDIRELLAELLAAAGHTNNTANNGALALQLLAMHSAGFDLIVTDILMPERDGLEVLWELQTVNPRQKVIAISGAPTQWMVLETAAELGASRTVAKPFTPIEIIKAVESVSAS